MLLLGERNVVPYDGNNAHMASKDPHRKLGSNNIDNTHRDKEKKSSKSPLYISGYRPKHRRPVLRFHVLTSDMDLNYF